MALASADSLRRLQHRPYRIALGVERALEEISSKAGAKYDSDVVHACLSLFNERGYSLDPAN